MERLSLTIKNSGKPKTSWDLGMFLFNSNLLGAYIISKLSLVTFRHYSTSCGQLDEWVVLIQSNVTASGRPPAVVRQNNDPTEFYCYISPPGEEKKEMPILLG
jgi:hypothetical protein